MSVITDTFRMALLMRRAAGERVHEIARAANVRPNELSGITGGSLAVRRGDPRVLRVAAYLGVNPDDCFTDDAPPRREVANG